MATLVDRLIPMPLGITIQEKMNFWAKVDRSGGPDSCWPWTGSKIPYHDPYGSHVGTYGQFAIRRRKYLATRVSYYFEFGRDPGKLFACHECDNPLCVNPDHLYLGTHSENMRDKFAKGRATHRGHWCPTAVLDEEDIPVIRQRILNGETNRAIAKSLGVSTATIGMIACGQTWTHT